MLTVKTLLHPTDLTDASRNAFDMACEIARARGARVVVLHVVPPPNRHSSEVAIGNPIAGFKEIAPDVAIDTRVEKGDPAGVILRMAEEMKCDLIVMGTHGRTAPDRFTLPSAGKPVKMAESDSPSQGVASHAAKCNAETVPQGHPALLPGAASLQRPARHP